MPVGPLGHFAALASTLGISDADAQALLEGRATFEAAENAKNRMLEGAEMLTAAWPAGHG